MARRMVTEFGYSEKLGPLRYEENQEEVFLGHSVARQQNVSDATAKLIDDEIRAFVHEGESTARKILTEKREELERLAKGLLEYETLTGDEITRVINGEKIDRSEGSEQAKAKTEKEKKAEKKKPRGSVPTGGKRRPGGGMEPEPT